LIVPEGNGLCDTHTEERQMQSGSPKRSRSRDGRTEVDGPKFVAFFGPVLDALRDLGNSARPKEVADWIANNLNISDEKLNELLKNGNSRFKNQVDWARFYLSKTGYIGSARRGIWTLTDLGRGTHLNHESALEVFHQVQDRSDGEARKPASEDTTAPDDEETDKTTIDDEARFKEEATQTLRSLSPQGFEQFCQLLLRAVGFEEVKVTGRSGDGGIDGIGTLRVNRLLTDRVVFQCKRYKDQIAPEFIRGFRGAMQGRADRGIFIATTTFSAEAAREAAREGAARIELVGLAELVELMAELELGARKRTINVVDQEFFVPFGIVQQA
jgi:restriction system protein